ncbi:hypothetical protein [Colwellia psychrerythraea]|uniref:Uncharacterized protein n=1 Tax=Colwellia psychrerythraea TaxID=28229 RepID=A0A099KAK5_COLPS|nr:hypothetical protein [Colwellia psychrerythraea]KGJ87391.1 hypothetical protein GAB14E_4546 [Colwellia psychrerythraea]
MDDWLAIFMIVITVVIIIGNLSTFQKSSKQKMRKNSLNDLKETLPRTKKSTHKMAPIEKKQP